MDMNKPSESTCNNNIQCVLNFLRNGTSKIDFSEYNEAILVLGPTGSGKTTLTQFLAGNNDKLHSTYDQNDNKFYFVDDASKIRKVDSFGSYTEIPELVYDKDTKTAYIDCPGFDDNRSELQDIRIAYFIVRVFKEIKNVKILLVISNLLIESNGDRDNLLRLLQNVSILFKNIDKYVGSIALVVTKVDPEVSERNMINRIAHILQQAKTFILNEQKNGPIIQTKELVTQKQLYSRYVATLLDSLVGISEGKNQSSKIGIFRRPNEEKTLSNMPLFQDSKKALKSMVNKLKYSTIEEHDIWYAISDSSRMMIQYLATETNEFIVNDIGRIGEIIIEYYKHMEAKMIEDDMFLLLERLKGIHKFLNDLQKTPVNDWVTQYQAHLDKPCIRASKQYLNEMESLDNFLIFLEKMGGKKLDSYALNWIDELHLCTHNIENSIKWYQFLATLYETLSKYEIQRDRSIHAIPKLKQYEGSLKEWQDFILFVEKLQDPNLFKMISFQDLQKLNVDSTKIRYFNKVIESTMCSTISFQSFDKGQRVQITGDYIKFSNLVDHKMFQSSKSVQILATHTVFIDANLTKDNDLLVIAPRWDIIGSQTISLDGSFGTYHKSFRAPSDSGRGKDGEPGNPGESAGHFFGIGKEFINPSNLTISAVGGPGGNGQHGGDGLPGKSSINAQPLSEHDTIIHCPNDMSCEIKFFHIDTRDLVVYSIRGRTGVEMRVPRGERGGDCGFGGGSGLGGYEGTADILNLGEQQVSIAAQVTNGSDGLFGLHGRVGKGGEGGDQYNIYYVFQDNNPLTLQRSDRIESSKNGDPGSCLDSKHPSYSYFEVDKNELYNWTSNSQTTNMNYRKDPQKKTILYKFSTVMKNYRNLLVDNFSHCIKKRHSLAFYDALLQNQEILKNDTVVEIFAEMEHLETRYHEFTQDINQYLYLSLHKRIQKKDEIMFWAGHGRPQHHDLLNLMSVAITSKLIRFGAAKIPQLISDHRTYFNVLKTTNIDYIFNYFTSEIEEKNQQFVSDLIKMLDFDISNIIELITRNITKLSDQPTNEKLIDQLLNRKLFSNFKTMTTFLKLCESLAKSDMEFANTMGIIKYTQTVQLQSSTIDGETLMKIISALEKSFSFDSEAAELEINLALDAFSSMVGSYVYHIMKEISEIQQVFQTHEPVAGSYIYPTFSKVQNVLQKINDIELENFDLTENQEAFEIIKRLQNALKLIVFDAGLYHRIVVKKINIENVVSIIDRNHDRTILFNSVENEIFNIITPVLILVRESLEGKWYKPKDIIKSREIILEALNHMKSHLTSMINEFEMMKNFQSLTENLDEAIILSLNTYQGILPIYHDRVILNKLNFSIENQKTRSNVHTKLANIIKSDILLYEYKRLVEIYEKNVFPFNILVPETFEVATQGPHTSEPSFLAPFEQSFVSKIQDLELKLDTWKNFKEFGDKNFFSSENTNGPFFTWKHDIYRDTIRKLLRGEKVAMKAKISKYNPSFLKFNDIGLRFNLKNSTTQVEFNDQLKNFKVTMTHSGSSYFNLCDHTHLYSQTSTNYTYYFEKNDNKADSHFSNILTQSPFTIWIFEMKPVRNNATFRSIEPFSKFEIDLELEGEAKFINMEDEKSTCMKIETRSDFSNNELLLFADLHEVNREIFLERTKRDFFESFARTIYNGATTVVNMAEILVDPVVKIVEPIVEPVIEFVKPIVQPIVEKIGDTVSNFITDIIPENMLQNLYPTILPPKPPPFWTSNAPCKYNWVQSLDVNSTLMFFDYIIRSITKKKLFDTGDRSPTPAQARIISLIIVDEFRAKMREEHWETVDPVQLMSQLERNILDRDIAAISKTLIDSMGAINAGLDRKKCKIVGL